MYPALQDAQAPVPEEQARQVEGVPAAQHTPLPHVALEHSVWESQAAPGAFGVMQRPVLEMTWPWGQLSGCACAQVHVWGGVSGKGKGVQETQHPRCDSIRAYFRGRATLGIARQRRHSAGKPCRMILTR